MLLEPVGKERVRDLEDDLVFLEAEQLDRFEPGLVFLVGDPLTYIEQYIRPGSLHTRDFQSIPPHQFVWLST